MKYGLKDEILEKIIIQCLLNKEIKDVILYGSRAIGNYKTGSDIDLTLIGENLSLKDIFKLEEYLDTLNLPYKFDVSIFGQIDNENLKKHINDFGISILQAKL
jgi:predicted nucleotidyltransferase